MINSQKLDYVFSFFLMQDRLIAYRTDWQNSDKPLVIVPVSTESQLPQPQLPLKQIEGVPLLYGEPRVERKDGKLIVHADIIASAFFLLSRYEEVLKKDVRDQHGRFPGRESLPSRAGFIDRPIVDEYGRLLRKWLREAGVDAPEPEGKFKVSLTHDVDNICKYNNLGRQLKKVIKTRRGKRNLVKGAIVKTGLKKDPFDNFEYMRRIDNEFRDKADFDVDIIYFFMAGGSSRYDGNYSIGDKRVKKLIKKLSNDGAIIGLHPSYEAGGDPLLIKKEKERLEEVCGFEIKYSRHHFLRFREPEHARYLAKAEHDYTLGYADVAGFRCGTCRPFKLWDHDSGEPLPIIEHPLQLMDCSLSGRNYMNLSEEEAFKSSQRFIDQCRRFNGELVLLWHNNVFGGLGGYHSRLYSKILEYLLYAESSP